MIRRPPRSPLFPSTTLFRSLDGVADLVDLPLQPADALVGDVRDLLEDQLLDLGLRDPLVDVAGALIEQQRVTGAQPDVPQRLGEPHHALLVDRKSTRLNSSHANISYAVFCLKKKKI